MDAILNVQAAQLCAKIAFSGPGSCRFGDDCKFSHDVEKFLKTREADLPGDCHIFAQQGHCPAGLNCRFGAMHIQDGRNIDKHCVVIDKEYAEKNCKDLHEG